MCLSQGYTIYYLAAEYAATNDIGVMRRQPTKTSNYISRCNRTNLYGKLGYTTHTCKNCSETHKSDYIEATGHKLSDWIINTPASIEQNGKKHIECVICGTVINTDRNAKAT